MKVTIQQDGPGKPVRVIRKHKPRGKNGGGPTLGEFSDTDGQGRTRAEAYVSQHGHEEG